jgi:hypothetical protein
MTTNVCDKTVQKSPARTISLEDYVMANVPDRHRYWILHERGYADRFDWVGPDREVAKREKEQSIVDEWAAAVYRDRTDCPFVKVESCMPPLPDCQLVDRNGRKTGVEVTELVDQATIERNKTVSYHWKEYSADEFTSAIAKRLQAKDCRCAAAAAGLRQANFHRIIVILHCDEPDLRSRPIFCREVLSNHEFPRLTYISEAWLLLPCPRKKHLNDFEAEFCQPIFIPLPK